MGRVAKLVGMVTEISGMSAPIGSLCRIDTGRQTPGVMCEVVGFRGNTLLVMPYQDANGVAPGQVATVIARQMTVPVGKELLGRIVNGLGQPLDGGPALGCLARRRLASSPPPAMTRQRKAEILPTGIRAVDSLISTAKGQRLGIFAGSGVGKSVLLGMLARHARVDVNVVALIGERGREVKEFIERDLGPEGLARSVVVVVTSDESAVMRAKGAETAMTIAEWFREADQEVLFLMDSATRYAMSLREIGLAAGEPPTTKGYPPSVFAALPRLCERAGWSAINAMTAFITVLIEGDDIHDPIGDAMRSILDGHLMLSRDLARESHYPAIDPLGSISRLRQDVLDSKSLAAGTKVMQWLKALEDNRDLINIGAYAAGSDPLVDQALTKFADMRAFLRQAVHEYAELTESLASLQQLTAGEAA
jgi:flagellum-specific ATP synthase